MSSPNRPPEQVLTGGNVAARVVRIGSTVRKPASALIGAHARAMSDLLQSATGTNPGPACTTKATPGTGDQRPNYSGGHHGKWLAALPD